MMKRTLTFLMLVVIVFTTFGTALAQEPEPTPVCEGASITGTVVAVDEENGLVTVDVDGDGVGDCTVTVSSDYDHPIVALLGAYFGEVSVEDLAASLESTQVCVVQDPDTLEYSTYTPAEGEECPGQTVSVTGENEDGTFNAQTDEGEPIVLSFDEETSGELSGALDGLSADWELTEEGDVADVGDDIADYHEAGYGFGVIVKVYAIAAEYEGACPVEEPTEEGGEPAVEGEEPPAEEETCGTTVEELFALLEGGAGMGDLFETFGKPTIVGIGHVRNGGDSGSGDGSSGICNARSSGGNANATGQGDITCDSENTKDKDKDKPDDGDGDTDGDD